MTTKTDPTMTAAEARALADKLAAAEQDLAQRRDEATRDAHVAEAQAIVDRLRDEAAEKQANAAWQALVDSDDATVPELFEAFCARRLASATRATTMNTADGVASQARPKRYSNGDRQPYWHNTTDSLAGASFAAALDQVIEARAERARHRAARGVSEAVQAAGEAAAAEVR